MPSRAMDELPRSLERVLEQLPTECRWAVDMPAALGMGRCLVSLPSALPVRQLDARVEAALRVEPGLFRWAVAPLFAEAGVDAGTQHLWPEEALSSLTRSSETAASAAVGAAVASARQRCLGLAARGMLESDWGAVFPFRLVAIPTAAAFVSGQYQVARAEDSQPQCVSLMVGQTLPSVLAAVAARFEIDVVRQPHRLLLRPASGGPMRLLAGAAEWAPVAGSAAPDAPVLGRPSSRGEQRLADCDIGDDDVLVIEPQGLLGGAPPESGGSPEAAASSSGGSDESWLREGGEPSGAAVEESGVGSSRPELDESSIPLEDPLRLAATDWLRTMREEAQPDASRGRAAAFVGESTWWSSLALGVGSSTLSGPRQRT